MNPRLVFPRLRAWWRRTSPWALRRALKSLKASAADESVFLLKLLDVAERRRRLAVDAAEREKRISDSLMRKSIEKDTVIADGQALAQRQDGLLLATARVLDGAAIVTDVTRRGRLVELLAGLDAYLADRHPELAYGASTLTAAAQRVVDDLASFPLPPNELAKIIEDLNHPGVDAELAHVTTGLTEPRKADS